MVKRSHQEVSPDIYTAAGFFVMTELVWEGKYKDGKKQGPVRIALPFQTSQGDRRPWERHNENAGSRGEMT
jgi:hypothetical protein